MRVVIAGGSGLIGRALVSSLAADGIEVIILSRNSAGVAGLPPAASAVAWDGRTAGAWAARLDGAAAVVNLAGENLAAGRWTEARKKSIISSRVDPGIALVEAIKAATAKPDVLIQSSGIGHYGSPGDEVINEDSPAGAGFQTAVTTAWEASTAPVEAMGVRRVVVRTGPVLSMDGGALPRMMLPFRFFAGGRIGNGKQWFSWIHIADAVASIRFLIDRKDAAGVVNLVAPAPVTNAEFARSLGRAMSRPSLIPAPAFAMRLLFGEMAEVLLEGQRAVPQRLIALGYRFRFPDIDGALRDVIH
jgi:uncharacterized protein